MKSYDNNSKEYYLLRKKRYLILKNKDLIEWFSRTYDRKLKYYISKNQLVNLILEFKNTDYDGFKSISKTLKSNFEYIINSLLV